jgi:hypothetical protein
MIGGRAAVLARSSSSKLRSSNSLDVAGGRGGSDEGAGGGEVDWAGENREEEALASAREEVGLNGFRTARGGREGIADEDEEVEEDEEGGWTLGMEVEVGVECGS